MCKHITSIFVLMCCFFLMSTNVHAETAPTLNITTTDISDQTLQMELELKNNPGFLSYQLMLQYDSSKLKPVKVKNSVTNGTLMYNLDASYKDKSCIKFAFANTEVSNMEGALFTVLFDIVNPSEKDYAFSLISHQFFDKDGKALLTKNGSAMEIEVTTPAPVGNEGIIMKTPAPHIPDKTAKPNGPNKTQKPTAIPSTIAPNKDGIEDAKASASPSATIIPSGSPASSSYATSETEAPSSNKETIPDSVKSPKPTSEEPLNSEKPLSESSNTSEAVEHVPSTSPTVSADIKNDSSNADTSRNFMPYLLIGIFILAFFIGILLKKHKSNKK